jgi:hydroxymethylpyrimidine pyrophosphatase-like HAD family hydrolase
MPRVAVFDLDGTLLDSAYELSPRTSAALKALADAGALIVLATGRPVDAVLGQVDGHHADFAVGSNGRELYSFETDHRVHEHFPIDLAVSAGRSLRVQIPGVRLALFTDVTVHFEDGWLELVPERPVGMVAVEDALAAPGGSALRLGAFHPDRRAVTLLTEARSVLPDGLDAHVSGLDSLDIGAAGIDKLAGVRRLTGQLGVRRHDVIAFGDNLNDHGVLSWAGRGIAMGNADPETIAVADEVTVTNDEDGVAVVLEALLREVG